jgi:hypothetical protein
MPNYVLTSEHDKLVVSLMSLFEIGGVILNDRANLECYWIDQITGFEDADLRVSSEENSAADGSTANPGFYGERIMTFTGRIRAGDTRTLDVMEDALAAVLMTLQEQELTIYQKPRPGVTLQQPRVIINCRKADKFQADKALNSYKYERTFTFSLRASDPLFLSETEIGPGILTTDSATAKIYPDSDISASFNWAKSSGSNFYSLLDEDQANLTIGDYVFAYTYAGGYSTEVLDIGLSTTTIVSGNIAVTMKVHANSNTYNGATASLCLADGTVLLTAILDSATPVWETVDGIFPLTQAQVNGLHIIFVHEDSGLSGGVGGSGEIDTVIYAAYAELTWQVTPSLLTVSNIGNYAAKPKLRFVGPMTNPLLSNAANGHVVKLNGAIAAGQWIEVDTATGLVYDANGLNKFAQFDTTSDWMRLAKGANALTLLAVNTNVNSKAEIRHRHTWMAG